MPDVMTLAKALGNGVPIGAMVVNSKAATVFSLGDHAATFGGNFLSCAASCVVLKRLLEGDLLSHVESVGTYFKKQLQQLSNDFSVVKEVRGLGLMLGMELTCEVRPIIDECMKNGMLIVQAGTHVLRFVPPLIIEKEDVDTVIAILRSVLSQV
jgi:acetylornithine/succinyldiaminopimelate/putrescine aminotransferase